MAYLTSQAMGSSLPASLAGGDRRRMYGLVNLKCCAGKAILGKLYTVAYMICSGAHGVEDFSAKKQSK